MKNLKFLFFLSGLTALVFQIIWLRIAALILGSTLYAFACVVTAFMIGIGVGSFVVGLLLKKNPMLAEKNILWYGIFELFIGIYALATVPFLFQYQETILKLIHQWTLAGGLARLCGVHLGVSFLILILPTSLMGATLPLLSYSLKSKKLVSSLYGFNLYGACAGSLAASFILIKNFGCIKSAAIACGINVFIFINAIRGHLSPKEFTGAEQGEVRCDENAGHSQAFQMPFWQVTALSFFSGYIFLHSEMVWVRLLSLILGNRVYVTSVVMGIVLFCLALGARISATLAEFLSPLRIIVSSYFIASLVFFTNLYCNSSLMQMTVDPSHTSMSGAIRLLIIFALCLIPATCMGIVFPTLLGLSTKKTNWGVEISALYAVNTIGSILGSLLGGYVWLDKLGSYGSIVFAIILMAVVVCWLSFSMPGMFYRVCSLGILGAALFIGKPLCAYELPLLIPKDTLRFFKEDAHGIFVVSAPFKDQRLRVQNNATDLVFLLGEKQTQYVQESQAYFPAIYAKKLDRALNIGAGYGITAGALSNIQDFSTIDAVEIVPLLYQKADLFSPYNKDYFKNPRVTVHLTDGRYFLAAQDKLYDVISINVSDPYLPGSSSLFSRDFYRMAAGRLTPDGILCQHLFGPDINSLIAGLRSVFPYLKAIPSYSNGLTVVASRQPLVPYQLDRFSSGEWQPLLRQIGISGPEGLNQLIQEGDAVLAKQLEQPVEFVNTDDQPNLEFRIAKGAVNVFYSNQ